MNTHGQQIEIGERHDQQFRCCALALMEIETLNITGLQLMRLEMKEGVAFLALIPMVSK